jgi:hypothetical protein
MIMAELTHILGAPEELRPSLRQWRAIIKMCNGTLERSTFGCVLGHFTQLHPKETIGVRDSFINILNTDDASHTMCFQQNDRSLIAEGLEAFAKISRGDLVSIEIVGNFVCAWLASFANFFLGFGIEIRNPKGDILYRSIGDETPVHVYITYGPTSAERPLVVARLYSIDGADDLTSTRHCLSQGRLEWANVLNVGFGSLGQQVYKSRHKFGQMFSALAMVSCVSNADPGLIHHAGTKSTDDEVTKVRYNGIRKVLKR